MGAGWPGPLDRWGRSFTLAAMAPPDSRHEPDAALLEAARRWLSPVRASLGSDFVAACLTGSVLTSGYDPKHSHVNVLVLARALNPATLEGLAAASPKQMRAPFFDPLFITRAELEGSLDVFPIEWLDVTERYLLLEGEDVFATLVVPREKLRLQIEHDLRGKHLRLRMQWLAHTQRPTELRRSLVAGASGYHAIFRALLRLRGESAPASHGEAIERVAAAFQLDAKALRGAHELRYAERNYTDREARERYRAFLVEIERLVMAIDQMPVAARP